MSVNRELPHIMVLPEDDANRQIANGFRLSLEWRVQRRIQVLPPPGGWTKVLDEFESEHVCTMDRNSNRFMVLVIDFDDDLSRLGRAQQRIPARLAARVFVLGALSQPERLKAELGPYEEIGSQMATDCHEERDQTWRHKLLRHNAGEVSRLRECARAILF